jgi:hypothetical protein
VIEKAFLEARAQVDAAVLHWQTRIAAGKTVGRFAERAAHLLASARGDYNARVIGTSEMVLERSERLQRLQEHALLAANKSFRQQLVLLEYTAADSFREKLVKLLRSKPFNQGGTNKETAGAAVPVEEPERAALRETVAEFRAQAAELEDAELGMVLTDDRVDEVTAALEQLMAEFPESSLAKLEEVRKLERYTTAAAATSGRERGTTVPGRGRRRRGLARALGVSLGLVGMLRPPGFGNLQGFVGYATSVFGTPLDLLLGVQNDGDAPEVRAAGAILFFFAFILFILSFAL